MYRYRINSTTIHNIMSATHGDVKSLPKKQLCNMNGDCAVKTLIYVVCDS